MLILGGRTNSPETARNILENTIKTGAALDKLAQMVARQGGDASYVYDTNKFRQAEHKGLVYAEKQGTIQYINALTVGNIAMELGAGRRTKESAIDPTVGVIVNKKVGEFVRETEAIACIYANSADSMKNAQEKFREAYAIESN
jgi:pyrimidine-nucleoside phosphorylase